MSIYSIYNNYAVIEVTFHLLANLCNFSKHIPCFFCYVICCRFFGQTNQSDRCVSFTIEYLLYLFLTNLIDHQTVTGNDTKMMAVKKGLFGLYVVIM